MGGVKWGLIMGALSAILGAGPWDRERGLASRKRIW